MADPAEHLKSGMIIEAEIVQRYETLLSAIMAGIFVTTGTLSLSKNPTSLWLLFAFSFLASAIVAKIAIGRAFHYALYERYREEWARQSGTEVISSSIQLSRNEYDTRNMMFGPVLGATIVPNYVLWPAAAFLVPFVGMCIGAAT